MLFKDIEAFENYLEAIDEFFEEGSKIIKEPSIFIKIDRNKHNKVKMNEFGQRSKKIDMKFNRLEDENCSIPTGGLNCFFRCILFLCLKDNFDYKKIVNKEDYVNFFT